MDSIQRMIAALDRLLGEIEAGSPLDDRVQQGIRHARVLNNDIMKEIGRELIQGLTVAFKLAKAIDPAEAEQLADQLGRGLIMAQA